VNDSREPARLDPADETPQAVLVGLFPRSMRRNADCLVYRDRFVFVGLSRKAAAKRVVGRGPFDLAMLPLAAVLGATGMAAAEAGRDHAMQLSPELAEAAAKSRTILFADVRDVRFSKLFGFGIKLTFVDGTTESLTNGPQFTDPKAIEAYFRQVVPHAVR
jgi:hypothetical protein